MTDREKLIEIIGDKPFSSEYENYNSWEWAEHFADHLLANGVIVPPCKVGDKVYIISICKQIDEYIVSGICQYPRGVFIEIYYKEQKFTIPVDKVFLTKEEAEAELKKRGKENG